MGKGMEKATPLVEKRSNDVSCTRLVEPLLAEELFCSVTDRIWGKIYLDAQVITLIATPVFLRLQRIQQLGFVSHAWPGATHTRYEHSLGCYHLARQAIRSLLHRDEFPGLAKSSVEAFMVAALLHDVGHYPFSHTIEELGYPLLLHEQVGRSMIENGEIATILERDAHLSPERVADFIDPPKTRLRHPDDELLSHLLSGVLDIDKLDYLPRDARACTLGYGSTDALALLAHINLHTSSGQPRLGITQHGVEPLKKFLQMRHDMFLDVYWHPINRVCGTMLVRAVLDALMLGQLHVRQMMSLDDNTLISLLGECSMPESTRALATALKEHHHYQVVLVIDESQREDGIPSDRLAHLAYNATRRRYIERLLAEQIGALLTLDLADHEILLDILRPKTWDMDSSVLFDNPSTGMQEYHSWSESVGWSSRQRRRFMQPQHQMHIIATESLAARLLASCEVLLRVVEQVLDAYAS